MKVKERDTLARSMATYSDRRLKRKLHACKRAFPMFCKLGARRFLVTSIVTIAAVVEQDGGGRLSHWLQSGHQLPGTSLAVASQASGSLPAAPSIQ